jgi:hypothetical protein
MKRPSLYLDTSVISAFWYVGSNVPMQVRRLRTREWWDLERVHFDLVSSAFTENELRAGTFRRQAECVRMARRLRFLPATFEALRLAEEMLRRGIVPQTKTIDAAHLAVSTTHGSDFLLTWNYAHMANPIVQTQLSTLCDEVGLVAPWMVSPESVPQVRFGQVIRRPR